MKTIYKGKIVTLKIQKVKFSDGHSSLYESILHKPAVAVVPLIDDQHILLIKQFRPVTNEKLWELPAGLIDGNEMPRAAAKRELEEETGFRAKKIIKLAEFYSSPGFTDEKIFLFLAYNFVKTKQKLDEDEKIDVKIFSIDTLLKMIKNNKIKDAKTILGILLTNQLLFSPYLKRRATNITT